MKFLKYLYQKYYYFQVRMGNYDIAPFSAMLIISFTVMLYYFALFFIIITFFPRDVLKINMLYFQWFSMILFFALILIFYFLLVHKRKYKKILKNSKKENNWIAILFPSIAFILFNLSWVLKMLQNQGRI